MWINAILSLISRGRAGEWTTSASHRTDETGPQALTPGGGIGARTRLRHLPSGCARLAWGISFQDPYRCRSTVLPTPAACELMGGAYTRRPYHELRLHPSSCLAAGGAGVHVVAHDPHETAASRVDVVSSRRDGILMPSGFDTVQASEQWFE